MRWLLALAVVLAQEASAPLRLAPEEYPLRRAALAKRLPGGPLVLDAGVLREPGDDANTAILDFRYLAGFHDAEGLLVLKDGKAHVFVSDPKRPPQGDEEVHDIARFPEWAAGQLAAKTIHAKLRPKNLDLLRKAAPGAEIEAGPLRDELVRMRLVKNEAEIRLIRKASEATTAAFRGIMKGLRPRLNEKDIQGIVLSAFKANGCPETGFPPILGAGKNGTILHYRDNDSEIAGGTLLLCDIGAACDGYSADITRTFPVSGRFDPDQRKHYQGVLDALKAAEKVLRPGATFGDLDRAARAVFEERGLKKWSYAHSKDFAVRHGIGHHVGLNVHDSGTGREKFVPGMVVTIEPGWYDKDAGYGIRIEDLFLVTPDGCERLSAAAPREIEEIEQALRPRRDY
jgi:Xaa-Pro aminopeptidase